MNAVVNQGRWVASCVTAHCYNAHLVTPGDRFVCGNCGADHGLVVFPDDTTLIDVALSARRVPQTRNWSPGETVADLIAETLEHEGAE